MAKQTPNNTSSL